MTETARYRVLFYSAATFNILVGLCFIAAPDLLIGQMTGHAVTTAPRALTVPFGVSVIMFGIGYAWAGKDFAANRAIIKLGTIGKAAAFLAVVGLTLTQHTTLSALGGASIDLVYALLFARALGWL